MSKKRKIGPIILASIKLQGWLFQRSTGVKILKKIILSGY